MMFLFSAAISFLQYVGVPEELAALVYWMFGSLSKANWEKLQITTLIFITAAIVIYRMARI